METTIKPIETNYAGCRFRSRLEARWAVFFDHLDIPWTYEHQGYKLPSGAHYLPDFYLPDSNIPVEVKGSPQQLELDLPRMEEFVQQGAFLLLLGDIPKEVSWVKAYPLMTYTSDGEKPAVATAFFAEGYTVGNRKIPGKVVPGTLPWSISLEPRNLPIGQSTQRMIRAYNAARSARFEHGECG